MIKILFIIAASIFITISSDAQLIDNNLNIYLSRSVGSFTGSETINKENYIAPSLYSNYKKFSGFSIKGLLKSKVYLSFGLNYEYHSANEWYSPNYADFKDSEIKLHSITPLVRIHNNFKEKGISNKLHVFFECGPNIGTSNLTLLHSLFHIKIDDNYSPSPMIGKNIFWGFKTTIGIEYSFIQWAGCFINYSYDLDKVSSKLYIDNTIKYSSFNLGFVIKLRKTKYLYY